MIVETVEQQTVVKIVPADPKIIYVPQYNPQIVYVEKPSDPGRNLLTFFAGVAIRAWLANDFDWHHRGVVVLPGGWRPGWHRPSFGGGIQVNIWRPRALPGRPRPPSWRRPSRPGPGWDGSLAHPGRSSGHDAFLAQSSWQFPTAKPTVPRGARHARTTWLRPSNPWAAYAHAPGAAIRQPQSDGSRFDSAPGSATVGPPTRPGAPQVRPAPGGSAFGGYNSGAATRDFSNRGAQSRQSGSARGGRR